VRGARAVQRSILKDFPNADISVSIVWINMLPHDTEASAKESAKKFTSDQRVRHFYDPEKRSGIAIAQGLGAEEGMVAWDMYLFYEIGSEWGEIPPSPANWMHQLKGSSWADSAHYRSGDDLIEALHAAMKAQ
jgi:hypothetical protein